MIKYIPIESLILYHDDLIEKYGGLKGIRDMGLLISSLELPKSAMFGKDLYPTIFDKAAVYLFHIICNHPFNDGNKRTGSFAALTFLKMNGYKKDFSEREYLSYENLILKVANGQVNKEVIAKFFKEI